MNEISERSKLSLATAINNLLVEGLGEMDIIRLIRPLLPTTCIINWHKEDFDKQAIEDGLMEEGQVMTDDSAAQIATALLDGHDAGYGVNWDDISRIMKDDGIEILEVSSND
jgi:hypothetical protein